MDDERATVLVIEDDAAERTFLADNLTADGYDLLVADCARDGLGLLERKFPDVAVVDLGLPDGDGLDLLGRVERRRRLGRLRVGELQIDPPSREVRLRERRVELSQKEFSLLRALAADPTRVFTKEELLRTVWGFRAMGSTRTLDSHACRLRQKLGRDGDRFVVNVWGVGYRLIDGPVDDA